MTFIMAVFLQTMHLKIQISLPRDVVLLYCQTKFITFLTYSFSNRKITPLVFGSERDFFGKYICHGTRHLSDSAAGRKHEVQVSGIP